MIKRPIINIKRGKLIEPFIKPYIMEKYPNYIFQDDNKVNEKISLFKDEWSKYENLFFDGLKKINLEFKRNIIDVFIVSAITRDMSSPLIIMSRYSTGEFISVLVHELIHVLSSDNKYEKRYKEETQTVRNHVYTFALMTYIFKDIFKEAERIMVEKSKAGLNNNLDYYKAWTIVDRDGYLNIIEMIKEDLDTSPIDKIYY